MIGSMLECALRIQRRSFCTAILLPALDLVPSDFVPNLLRVMQRRARILPALRLPALDVFPGVFLGLIDFIHGG